VPIAVPGYLHQTIANTLDCAQGTFPIKYLRLPLSSKKPNEEDFLPILIKVQSRLARRQNNQLSLAGRKVIINSVLNALPLHFMQAFLLPQWLIKHLERVKRAFFWKGRTNVREDNLVNWKAICLPKKHVGIAIRDLKTQNISLLLKWLSEKYNQNILWYASI
jgi:hypothetical protein